MHKFYISLYSLIALPIYAQIVPFSSRDLALGPPIVASGGGGNSVTFDSNFTNICLSASVRQFSWTLTVPANSSQFVMVSFDLWQGTGQACKLTNVVCGASTMTMATNAYANNTVEGGELSVWYLANPPTGSQTFTATADQNWFSSPENTCAAFTTFLHNVNQATPVSGVVTNWSGNATANTLTVATTTGDMAFGFAGNGSDGGTSITGSQTVVGVTNWSTQLGCGYFILQRTTGNGNVTLTANAGSDWWAGIGLNVKHD